MHFWSLSEASCYRCSELSPRTEFTLRSKFSTGGSFGLRCSASETFLKPLSEKPRKSGTEKVPQRTFAAKISPNFRVNFLVRFASKPSTPSNWSENSLALFVRFFGFGVLSLIAVAEAEVWPRVPQPTSSSSVVTCRSCCMEEQWNETCRQTSHEAHSRRPTRQMQWSKLHHP